MPLSSYRPYRVPDHLNRSRYPVTMHHYQPNFALPPRAASHDARQHPLPARKTYLPSSAIAPNSHITYNQYNGHDASSSYDPMAADLGASYFGATPTPDTPEFMDEGKNSIFDGNASLPHNPTYPFGKIFPAENFGLGLGPLGSDTNSMAYHPEVYTYPAKAPEPEPVALEPASPEGNSWSSISDSGSGLISELSDLFMETNTRSFSSETISGHDSILSSRDRVSELAQRNFAKPASRGAVESSPHARFRTSPYPTLRARGRSMSAGSVALSRSQRGSPYIHSPPPSIGVEYNPSLQLTTASDLPAIGDIDFDFLYQTQPSAVSGGKFDPSSIFFTGPAEEGAEGVENAECGNICGSTHPSPEIVNILQSSNVARMHCDHQFAGSSSPPNLFGPLQDDQLSPPPEDMRAEEPNPPRVQELRFEGDLYTPKYVRGHGNKREGWCGICKPGRWLDLKNSAFWYDKSFTHGISAATGSAFESPKETRRMKGNPDVWEGLCHNCHQWIALISSKKKRTTWFRHAYKVSAGLSLLAGSC